MRRGRREKTLAGATAGRCTGCTQKRRSVGGPTAEAGFVPIGVFGDGVSDPVRRRSVVEEPVKGNCVGFMLASGERS